MPLPMHLRARFTLVLLALLLVSCSGEAPNESPVLGTLAETLRLGPDEERENDAQLFGRISQIAADEEGRIYVAEGQAREIRVFDEQGNHLETFGEAGEGPGEFQSITAMTVDRQGRLVVADPLNSRISILDTDGQLLDSHPSPTSYTIRQISELPNGQFLFVGLHNDHLVHLVDADFERVLSHLVPVSEVLHTEAPIEKKQWLPRMPGHAAVASEDKILYAPSIYGGELSVYERDDADTWTHARSVDAHSVESPPVTLSENEEATFAMPDGRALEIHSLTRGLFSLNYERAIHVFSRETEEGVSFLAGIVSADGTYEGHLELPAREYDEHFSLRPFEVDASNRLYLADLQDIPLVRRMSLSLE